MEEWVIKDEYFFSEIDDMLGTKYIRNTPSDGGVFSVHFTLTCWRILFCFKGELDDVISEAFILNNPKVKPKLSTFLFFLAFLLICLSALFWENLNVWSGTLGILHILSRSYNKPAKLALLFTFCSAYCFSVNQLRRTKWKKNFGENITKFHV